ncbi:MAG: nucleotide exchange factor GrpE [Bacillaceae bacterium]|nr:nucleotide exchange factor GrpE [Bacillaceae bacterium]
MEINTEESVEEADVKADTMEDETKPEQPSVETDQEEASTDEVSEDVNALTNELEQVKREKDDLYDRLLRLQADYENYRRRTKKERENDLKYKSQSVIMELLPVLDNFERALQIEVSDEKAKSFVDGIQMVHRQLKDALAKEGLEEIPTVGEQFDPHLHQAVMQVQDEEKESNEIVEELQKGYKLKDRIIRPAMVKVNQ